MKQMVAILVLMVSVTGAAFAANNNVYVEHAGNKEYFKKLDFDSLSVCSFKQQVADQFGLSMRKFDLTRGRTVLNERKTMRGAYISNSNVLSVVEKSNSNQCT